MDTRKFCIAKARFAALIASVLVLGGVVGCSSNGGPPESASGGNTNPNNSGGAGDISGGSGGSGAEQGSGGQRPNPGETGGAGQTSDGGVPPAPSSGFHSPYAVAYSDDSATLAVSDSSAGELAFLDPKAGTSLRTVKLN